MHRRGILAGALFFALAASIVVVALSRDRLHAPLPQAVVSTLEDALPHDSEKSAAKPSLQPADVSPHIAPASPLATSTSPAKTKRFEEMKRCVGVVRAIESMRRQIEVCQSLHPSDAWCKERIAPFDEKLKRAETILSDCSAADIGDSENRYWQSVVAAAEAGDANAALCYVQSDFSLDRPWSKDEIERYKALAPTYIDRAFSAGDWRIVGLLALGPRGYAENSLLRFLDEGERMTRYRMERLLRLGAVGQYAVLLNAAAIDPESPLPEADRIAAETWAKDMYTRYFSKSPRLESYPDRCKLLDKDISPY